MILEARVVKCKTDSDPKSSACGAGNAADDGPGV